MPCVHATGRSNQGKTFNIAFAFITAEKVENYALVVEHLGEIFKQYGVKPTAIITDKEAALKKALRKSLLFSNIKQIIC